MNKLMFRWLVVAAFLIVPAFVYASGWEVMTEELPPFNYSENGKVVGISADLLVEICAKAGVSIERSDVKILPWARAYNTVQNKDRSVLFSMARTEQREKLFKWVGPIYQLEIGLIAPKKAGIQIASASDLKKYRIGTVIEGAPEQLLVKQGMELARLDRLSNPENNIKKLAAGRIDMFSFNVPTAKHLMKKQGLNIDDYETVYSLKKAELYFAFNQEVSAKTIEALQDALKSLKENGDYARIVAHYL